MVIPLRPTSNSEKMQTWQKSSMTCLRLLGQTPSSHQFVGQQLKPSEMVGVYLADLRRLTVPFGGATDHMLECAFMARLPDDN